MGLTVIICIACGNVKYVVYLATLHWSLASSSKLYLCHGEYQDYCIWFSISDKN